MKTLGQILKPASAVLLAIFVLAGSSSCDRNGGGTKTEKITICQWGQALIYLPLYIAQHEGLFEKEGLSVNLTNGGADDLTWAAVTSGNAQFGVADPTMVAIQAEQGGVPGVVIGDVVGKVAFWAVTLDKSMPPIASPEGFKGQKVAAFKFPNTAHALALRTFAKGNLSLGKDVEMVEVNYGAVLAQLQSGGATLAMVLEPAASIAESEGAKIVYSYPQVWGDFAFTGLTVTKKYASERPETVQKVVNALTEAIRIAHDDPARTMDAAQKAFPEVKKEILEKAIKRMLSEGTIPAKLAPSADGWKKALEVCVEVKKLRGMPANPDSFLDPSFAAKAAK
jgi:NitT/TauT family transport system substrate-binding protein